MTTHDTPTDDANRGDGRVLDPGRVADHLAIQDLATSYAHAVDDRDWVRWEALFVPGGLVDYTSSAGIAGIPAELAAWMPGALSVFAFTLHTTATHEIRFTAPDTASGRVHVFNRNGVEWEGTRELFDVGAIYEDTYAKTGGVWRIGSRVERSSYMGGGRFADMILAMAGDTATGDRPPPFG